MPPTSFSSTSGYSSNGSSASGYSSASAAAAAAPSGTGASDPADGGSVPPGYTNDSARSGTLTSYLQSHRLPLVGAQVLTDGSGNQQVVLYGFVASDFGRQDAADKARRYLHNPNAPVINRIAVRPELASGGNGSVPAPVASPNGTSGAYGSAGAAGSSGNELGSVQSYQDQAQQAQQQQQYMQSSQPSASGLTAIVPLIGMMGMLGMGSGSSFGMGGGGYPPTYGSPYGGGSPFGSPFSPYGSAPYGAAPYGSYGAAPYSPYGAAPYAPSYGYPRTFP